jgi:tetratricopeptide (TPR) repeat protein
MEERDLGWRQGYAAANELAVTGRYREARDSLRALLQKEPSNVEVLILLGKVEFYLRHAAESRRCFETALSYEPGNMAAFFGLEYHRQRSRRLFTAAVSVLLVAAIAGAAALLADRVGRSMRDAESSLEAQLNERLNANSAAQWASLDGVATAVEQLRASSEDGRKTTAKALAQLAAELQRLRRVNVNLQTEIERLRTAAGTANPGP